MKKIILFSILLILILTVPSFSQVVDSIPTCGTVTLGEQLDLSQEGGLYVTAQGTIRVLVVFVRFKDDTAPDSYWPANDQTQSWMTQYIDPNIQTGSTHYLNLTNYFKQMSLGVYNVIGDVVYVKTPQNRSYYGTPWPNRWLVTKDVLQNKVDPLVNFANYDNWTFNSNYHHTNQPDGTIDMIVMFWRGLLVADWYLGEASLGYGSNYTVEGGTKTIKTGFGGGAGSGFTAQYWLARWPEYNFHTPVHEYGHWLLGGSHPYGGGAEHNGWGLLFHSQDGICANTYERERVAWVNPTPITGDVLNAPFTDYLTTGTSYKYHPSNGATNEYFYFENHQKLSIYDGATVNSNDKGIFVLHFQYPYNESNNSNRIKPATGQWNWENPFNTNCWGSTVPAFRQLTVNRAGYSIRDKLPKSGGSYEIPYAIINEDDEAVCGGWYWGEFTIGSFNLAYNDVFSPYSNPRTHTWANQQNNFTMEVFNQNGSIVNARFYLTDPIAGKPSKPYLGWYHPGTGPIQYGWIYLAWNSEIWDGYPIDPDVNWSELQRKIGGGNWVTMYTGPSLSWSDGSITYDPNGTTPVYFRVRVRDSQGLWSVWSDLFNTKMMSSYEQKAIAGEFSVENPSEYLLGQNYPNPFNPTTRIDFSVKENGLTSLRVYNLLGREVANLVNENFQPGTYSVEFNASSLPSGIYFYRLTSGSFSETKKLILLK